MTPVDDRAPAADSLPQQPQQLKKPSGYWVHPSEGKSTDRLPPIRTAEAASRQHHPSHARQSGSTSPKSDGSRRSQNGLDMLLDAGMGRSSI